MAKPNYLRKIIQTGEVQRLDFTAENFKEAGFSSELSAMPILEAHELVNRWNLKQEPQRFVYALD